LVPTLCLRFVVEYGRDHLDSRPLLDSRGVSH
jgi:hypothetical protein